MQQIWATACKLLCMHTYERSLGKCIRILQLAAIIIMLRSIYSFSYIRIIMYFTYVILLIRYRVAFTEKKVIHAYSYTRKTLSVAIAPRQQFINTYVCIYIDIIIYTYIHLQMVHKLHYSDMYG